MMRVIEFDAPDLSVWATTRGDMLTASNIPIEQMSKAAFLPMDLSEKPATKTFLQPSQAFRVKAWMPVMYRPKIRLWMSWVPS